MDFLKYTNIKKNEDSHWWYVSTHKAVLQKLSLDFDAVRSRGYSFEEEILWHLKRLGAKFGEIPSIFVDRRRGQSKIDPREAINALGTIFSLAVRNMFSRRKIQLS